MRHADWPIIIERLTQVSDISTISKHTGIKKITLSKVKNETQSIEAWDHALSLLGLYLRNVELSIPLLGDHNE